MNWRIALFAVLGAQLGLAAFGHAQNVPSRLGDKSKWQLVSSSTAINLATPRWNEMSSTPVFLRAGTRMSRVASSLVYRGGREYMLVVTEDGLLGYIWNKPTQTYYRVDSLRTETKSQSVVLSTRYITVEAGADFTPRGSQDARKLDGPLHIGPGRALAFLGYVEEDEPDSDVRVAIAHQHHRLTSTTDDIVIALPQSAVQFLDGDIPATAHRLWPDYPNARILKMCREERVQTETQEVGAEFDPIKLLASIFGIKVDGVSLSIGFGAEVRSIQKQPDSDDIKSDVIPLTEFQRTVPASLHYGRQTISDCTKPEGTYWHRYVGPSQQPVLLHKNDELERKFVFNRYGKIVLRCANDLANFEVYLNEAGIRDKFERAAARIVLTQSDVTRESRMTCQKMATSVSPQQP